jgi:hypothetical protein
LLIQYTHTSSYEHHERLTPFCFPNQGTVYVFHRNSSVGNLNEFNLTARFRNSDTATNNEYFGCCVSIDGDTVVVGVDDIAPTASKKGAAFIFALPEVLVEVTDTEVTTTVIHSPPPARARAHDGNEFL